MEKNNVIVGVVGKNWIGVINNDRYRQTITRCFQ